MGDIYSSVLSGVSLSVSRPLGTVIRDGTFLIGKYQGTLLIAISVDASNKLVPLAFALVE
jgi:hypothetical protein